MAFQCAYAGRKLQNRWILKVSLVVAFALAGVLSNSAFAQSTMPATHPTATPATLPVADQSTPKGALRMLFTATDTGDAAVIRSVLHSTNPLEEKMATTMAEMSSAMASLQKAIRTTLGEEQARAQLGDPAAASHMRDELLARQTETIDGDHAVVKLEGMGNFKPVDLIKVDGKWKVLIGKSLEKADPVMVEKQLDATAIQVKVIREIAADVSAGKFKTVADVKQVMDAKVRQALMQYVQEQSKAATQPSTAPTTQPK